ncbi:MAG: hypothetical protein NC406_07910 [Bacteroides sp.]|nr:hypothetical protein [Bacteroides sp.]
MDIILTILREIVPTRFQLSHFKCVEGFIRSLLITSSVNLMKLARGMTDGCLPDNMEDTHLPLNGHFQNMLKLTLIAFACAFYDGLVRSSSKGIPVMKSNGRRQFSLFSFGLAIVVADLVAKPRTVKIRGETAP